MTSICSVPRDAAPPRGAQAGFVLGKQTPCPPLHPQSHQGKRRSAGAPVLAARWLGRAATCCCGTPLCQSRCSLRSGPRPGLESGCSETLHGHGICLCGRWPAGSCAQQRCPGPEPLPRGAPTRLDLGRGSSTVPSLRPWGSRPGQPQNSCPPRDGGFPRYPSPLEKCRKGFPSNPCPIVGRSPGDTGSCSSPRQLGEATPGGVPTAGVGKSGAMASRGQCAQAQGPRKGSRTWTLGHGFPQRGRQLGEWTEGRCRGRRALSVPGGVALTPAPQPACPGPTTPSMKGSGTSTQ